MKQIFVFLLLVLSLTTIYANGNKESSQTRSRIGNRQRYEKYVQTPMSLASCAITAGEVKFKLSVWQDKNANATSYDCQMKFSRWPSFDHYLPQLMLTIGDSMQITLNNDSIYMLDMKTQAMTIGDLKSGLQYLEKNQFVAFYAYWYNLAGQVANTAVQKTNEKNIVSTSFEILDADETQYAISGAGKYAKTYQQGKTQSEMLLQKYTYEPTKRWCEKSGFEKITCELNNVSLQKSPADWDNLSDKEKYATCIMLQSVVRLYRCNSRTYNDVISTCNMLIDGLKDVHLSQLVQK